MFNKEAKTPPPQQADECIAGNKQSYSVSFTGCGLKQNSENIGLDRIKGKGETMSHIYDLIIIGSGPAGLAAAVYAKRAKLDTLVVEKAMVSGGQVLTTYEVDNYPDFPESADTTWGLNSRNTQTVWGARFVEDEVLNIQDGGKGAIKGVVCQGNTYEARSHILATRSCTQEAGRSG